MNTDTNNTNDSFRRELARALLAESGGPLAAVIALVEAVKETSDPLLWKALQVGTGAGDLCTALAAAYGSRRTGI